MERTSLIYQTYVKILERELVPAMGCTEPIAVAYCAAKARELLEETPTELEIHASGNIIKNVKSVVVPHTNGLRGLEAAAAVGALYGDAAGQLEVISQVTEEEALSLKGQLERIKCIVIPMDTQHVLDLEVIARGKDHWASVHIEDEHTNIVGMCRDGESVDMSRTDAGGKAADGYESDCNREIYEKTADNERDGMAQKGKIEAESDEQMEEELDYDLLTVAGIKEFADTADLADVRDVLKRQIEYNTAIAREGIEHAYGARIGQVLLTQDTSVRTRAKAMAAAGSDARMSGCNLPVVINSGSGNQGMTASLPVVEYASHYHKTEEELYRALLVSNLVTLHLKSGIGRLSAYCGAVSAGVGAGAGIAYLMTGDLSTINHTIVNAIAITSGIVCDGAKASCAAKIAMAVEAGIMGFEMFEQGCEFYGGDGLVSKGVEQTIRNISVLGHEGMKETDKKIIEIMTETCC